jgi:tetratricopeptide (TPR) repeat protein
VIFGIAGLAIGFVVAFTWTRNYNNSAMVSDGQPRTSPAGAAAPAGESGEQAGMASVREKIERAKNNPNDFDAQIEAAQLYNQIGRVNEVVPLVERAYKIDSARAAGMDIPIFLAHYYSDQKDYANAEKWYRAELDAKPQDADTLIELGATYIDREPPNPDKAIDYLQSVLKSNPSNAHALVHLTQAYLEKRDAKGASDSLARAKQSDPGNKMLPELEKQLSALKSGQQVTLPKE